MAVNGFALGSIAIGSLFAYAGVTGKSVLKTAQSIVQGKTPQSVSVSNPIPLVSASANAASGNTGSPVTPAGGSVGQYQAYAFSQFSRYGWGTDQESFLVKLWNQESGWNPSAQNPTSTAYGIAQFLDTTWAPYGAKTSNPDLQIQYGLAYIHDRYGTPQMAWSHEVANNWY